MSRRPWTGAVVQAACVAAALGAGACAGSPETSPPAVPGTTTVRPGPVVEGQAGDASGARPEPAADPAGPVTHLGRSVFPKCHRMSVGTVAESRVLPRGVELLQVEETDVLWGPPGTRRITVVCGAEGLAPGAGGRALFLLRLLPSGSYEAVQVSGLDDDDGPARLAAFRRYLEIESLRDPEARREALLVYLRRSVAAEKGWTRANALREYEAFSDAFRGALGPDDAAVLSRIAASERNAELRRLAQTTLDRVPGDAASRAATTTSSAGDAPAASAVDLTAFETRFADRRGGPGPRRQALSDAAQAHGALAAPLVGTALDDEDPAVRAAAATIAGDAGMTSLGGRLVERLRAEESPAVRRNLVVALGHVRCDEAVPILGSYAGEGAALSREAAFALARIRTPAAMERLRRLAADEADAERAELARFLLTEDFVRQERALGARWAIDG